MHSIFRYSRISEESEEKDSDIRSRGPVIAQPSRLLWILSIGSTCLSIFSVGVLIYALTVKPNDAQCAEQLSPYSPALEAVEYEWRTYENDFAKESIYRGTPTQELETAWENLWQYGLVNVDVGRVASLNKSASDDWRRLPAKSGGGVGGFLEVFHQIHCLNLIRQYTYRDVHDYSAHPSFQGPAYLLRTHVDHCIETIRLNLMCISDVTPVLVKKDPSSPNGESPDFNTLHKCRRFDKLQEWMGGHVVANKLEHSGHHE